MGNTPAKHVDTSCPTRSWDVKNKRPIYVDKNAEYVFNFYGEYTRDEFLKANVDNPEFEQRVKDYVDECNSSEAYRTQVQSFSHSDHFQGKKYGIAWFNMAFIDPMYTIELKTKDAVVVARLQRFLGDSCLIITCISKNTTVKWQGTDADAAASYVCDLVHGQGITLVKNDLGIQEKVTAVKDQQQLQQVLGKLIMYIMSITLF